MAEVADHPPDPLAERVTTGLAKIGLALKHGAWQTSAARGLSPTQAQILTLLRARDPEGCRLGDLARALAVTPATVSEAVQALVRKGLVVRERSSEDGRALRLGLSEEGRRHAAALADWPDAILEAVDSLTPPEQATLFAALVKLILVLQQRGRLPLQRMCPTCTHFRPSVHPDPVRPHHCAFVDAPLGDADLRLDCPDHAAGAPGAAPGF